MQPEPRTGAGVPAALPSDPGWLNSGPAVLPGGDRGLSHWQRPRGSHPGLCSHRDGIRGFGSWGQLAAGARWGWGLVPRGGQLRGRVPWRGLWARQQRGRVEAGAFAAPDRALAPAALGSAGCFPCEHPPWDLGEIRCSQQHKSFCSCFPRGIPGPVWPEISGFSPHRAGAGRGWDEQKLLSCSPRRWVKAGASLEQLSPTRCLQPLSIGLLHLCPCSQALLSDLSPDCLCPPSSPCAPSSPAGWRLLTRSDDPRPSSLVEMGFAVALLS